MANPLACCVPPQAQALSRAVALTNRVDALTGGNDESGGDPLGNLQDRLTGFCGGATHVEEQDDPMDIPVDGEDFTEKFAYRVCVHHGDKLSGAGQTSIKIVIGGGTEKEKEFMSEPIDASISPLYEFAIRYDIEVVAKRMPRIDIMVMDHTAGSSLFGPAVDGSVSLRIPTDGTKGPQRKVKHLRPGPGSIRSRMTSSYKAELLVIWQVSKPMTFLPDLVRIGEMEPSAMDQKLVTITGRIISVDLDEAGGKDRQEAKVILSLKCPVKEVSLPARVSPGLLLWPKDKGKENAMKTEYPSDWPEHQPVREGYFSKEQGKGWEFDDWSIQESEVMLSSYILSAQVTRTPLNGGDKAIKLGTWSDKVGDLFESIEKTNRTIRFQAKLSSNQGDTGSVTMELDVYDEARHREFVSKSGESNKPAIRPGLPLEKYWNDDVTYHCTVYADGFALNTKPYVKIAIGEGSKSTKVSEQVNDARCWKDPLQLTTKRITRKALVEVYHSEAPRSPDILLGRQNEYGFNDKMDQPIWLHFYGGALGATVCDKAEAFAKGQRPGGSPPSTYQGSIVVRFGKRRPVGGATAFLDGLKKARHRARLHVRLFCGYGLQQLANKKVNVLVQVAGCRLPNNEGLKSIVAQTKSIREKNEKRHNKRHSFHALSSQTEETPPEDLERDAFREAFFTEDAKNFNRNILCFPGVVDAQGILRFDESSKTGYSSRCTPHEFPLLAPPLHTLHHCYLYIVPEGEESTPPKIWSRLPLRTEFQDPEAHDLVLMGSPNWRRLRHDLSVQEDLPQTKFGCTDLAGFILGSAAMVDLEKYSDMDGVVKPHVSQLPVEVANDADSKYPGMPHGHNGCICLATPSRAPSKYSGSLGDVETDPKDTTEDESTTTQEVVCHIDILAARALPAMDDDGLIDLRYEVEVFGTKLVWQGSNGKSASRSLCPNLMQRGMLKFKFNTQIKDDGTTKVPLPPVIFRLQDVDPARFSTIQGAKHENVGIIVVKPVQNINKNSGEKKYFLLGRGPESPKGKDTEFNVNELHAAYWYTLDGRRSAPFQAHSAQSLENTWRTTPRVLLAMGYSDRADIADVAKGEEIELEREKGSERSQLFKIKSDQVGSYNVQLDLLGVRNLTEDMKQGTIRIMGYWEDKENRLTHGLEDNDANDDSYTFTFDDNDATTADKEGNDAGSNWEDFAARLKPLAQLRDDNDQNDVEDDQPSEDLPVLEVDKLLGLRVTLPPYEAPILSYLTGERIRSGRWTLTVKGGTSENVIIAGQRHYTGRSVGPRESQTSKILMTYSATAKTFNVTELDSKFWEYSVSAPGSIEDDKIRWEFPGKRIYEGVLDKDGLKIENLKCGNDEYTAEADDQHPFVLLPSLIVTITNDTTQRDLGTMMVPLSEHKGVDKKSWIDTCLDEHKEVKEKNSRLLFYDSSVLNTQGDKRPPVEQQPEDDTAQVASLTTQASTVSQSKVLPYERKPDEPDDDTGPKNSHIIPPLKLSAIKPGIYCVFVDAFAPQGGYVNYPGNLQMGRFLDSQKLFTINQTDKSLASDKEVDDDDDDDDEPTTESGTMHCGFNYSDWLCTDEAYRIEPFDFRVAPRLVCMDSDRYWQFDDKIAQAEKAREVIDDDMNNNKTNELESLSKSLGQSLGLAAPEAPVAGAAAKKYVADAIDRINACLLEHCQDKLPNTAEDAKTKKYLERTDEYSKPKGPKDLDIPEDVRTAGTCGKMKTIMEKRYKKRLMSHLHAPEKQKSSASFSSFFKEKNLENNLHTFVRPVGHIINEQDRDSRYLARLRIRVPRHCYERILARLSKVYYTLSTAGEPGHGDSAYYRKSRQELLDVLEAEINTYKLETGTVNFLTIKFNRKHGEVIWAPPEEVNVWDNQGQILFVVRLKDGDVVTVSTPNFDIRFGVETGWYPVKTLSSRFRTLENRIKLAEKAEKKAELIKLGKTRKKKLKKNTADPDNTTSSGEEKIDDDPSEGKDITPDPPQDLRLPDGYSRPIAVAQYAFVIRVRRMSSAIMFDRRQTKNWWRATMDTVFPELDYLRLNNEVEVYRDFLQSRFMNLRKPIGMQSLFKGHVHVKPILKDKDATNSPDSTLVKLGKSVENLWMRETVYITFYLMSIESLEVGSLGIASNGTERFYVTAEMEGESPKDPKDIPEQCPASQGYVSFLAYHHFTWETELPGKTGLTIKIWNKPTSILGDAAVALTGQEPRLVGQMSVDLEDRWLMLMKRAFRASTNEDYLQSHVMPKELMLVKDIIPKKGSKGNEWREPVMPEKLEKLPAKDSELSPVEIHPARMVPDRLPIEYRELTRLDEDSGSNEVVGHMRFFLNLAKPSEGLAIPDVPPEAELEVRVTLKSITNICVFQDNERNDVFVKCNFATKDRTGRTMHAAYETDVHKFARDTANFNYLMVFPCTAPVKTAELKFYMMDKDTLTDHDEIYEPKVYSLDHLLMLAFKNARDGKDHLGNLKDEIIFDRWKGMHTRPKIWKKCLAYCGLMSKVHCKKVHERFARLQIEIQIIPRRDAEADPKQNGTISEPANRITPLYMATNPGQTARILLGQTCFRRLFCGGALVGTLIGVLLVFVILYYMIYIGFIPRWHDYGSSS